MMRGLLKEALMDHAQERLAKLEVLLKASSALYGDFCARDEEPTHFCSWFALEDALEDLEGKCLTKDR